MKFPKAIHANDYLLQKAVIISEKYPESTREYMRSLRLLDARAKELIASGIHGEDAIYIFEEFYENVVETGVLPDEVLGYLIVEKNNYIEKIETTLTRDFLPYVSRQLHKRFENVFSKNKNPQV